jgi:opacity protein-like surface antigen
MEKIRGLLLGTTLAVGVALAAGSAFAADLPTGVVSAPAAVEAGGSYVSVFAGVAFPVTASGNYGADTTFDAPFETGYIVGGAIGTHFTPNLRGEVELSYVSHNVTGTLTVGSPGNSFTTPDAGGLSTLYLLGNLWYDIDTGGGITPYIGGGAGLAVIMPNNFNFNSGTAVFNTDSAAFAGQLGLGIKFQLADNMTVDLGYRAKGVFNATITATNGPNATAVHYIDQTVQLGLTVGF